MRKEGTKGFNCPLAAGFGRSRLGINQQGVVELNGKLGSPRSNQQVSKAKVASRALMLREIAFSDAARASDRRLGVARVFQDERTRASLLPASLVQRGLPEINRSEWVVRLNCKGVLEGCDLVVQLVVGEEVATAEIGEGAHPPPISGCGFGFFCW